MEPNSEGWEALKAILECTQLLRATGFVWDSRPGCTILLLGSESTARSWRVQGQQLLTESQIFKDEVLPGPENTDHPPEEMPERRDHGKNRIGKAWIERCAKSFILWVYDDLARHSLKVAGHRDLVRLHVHLGDWRRKHPDSSQEL